MVTAELLHQEDYLRIAHPPSKLSLCSLEQTERPGSWNVAMVAAQIEICVCDVQQPSWCLRLEREGGLFQGQQGVKQPRTLR